MNRRRFFALLPAIALSPLTQPPGMPQTLEPRTLVQLDEWAIEANAWLWVNRYQIRLHDQKIAWLLKQVFDIGIKPEKLRDV